MPSHYYILGKKHFGEYEVLMNLSSVKFACTAAALAAAPLMAQNVLTNGDMSYGDGGWYIWNNPNGPAKYESKLGEMGRRRWTCNSVSPASVWMAPRA